MDITTKADRLIRIIDYGFEHGLIDDHASTYVEPGYSDPDSGVILFGNWNPSCGYDTSKNDIARDPHVQISRIAEKLGAELEWSDEWATCEDCNGAVRTQPDSYSWTRSYVHWESEGTICKDCALEEPDRYVTEILLNKSATADTFDVDLADLGFRKLTEGESGWHPGQDDTPEALMANVPDGHDYVFQIDAVGQFAVRFSLWVRTKKED